MPATSRRSSVSARSRVSSSASRSIGRGLRRTDYSDLSRPEFVDVYGVPFQLLPFAKAGAGTPIEPPKTTVVRTLARARKSFASSSRALCRSSSDVGDTLQVDLDSIEPLRVSAEFDPTMTYVEFETGSAGSGLGGESHDRSRAYEQFRLQRLVFRLAALIVAPYEKPWLFPQATKIVKEVLDSKVIYDSGVDRRELCNLRYVNLLRERIELAIRGEEGVGLLPVLDQYQPMGSTDGIAFSTAKPCEPTTKSHLSHAVCDSELERGIVRELERHDDVEAYAKNDRLFLEIPYRYFGRTRRYRPDFIVRSKSGDTLLIEGKGRPDEKDDAKATAARRWVDAINAWGKLGAWHHAICMKRTEVGVAIADLD